MAIKAVIFDCFGVLTTDGWLAFCNKYLSDRQDLKEEAKELNKLSDAGVISPREFIHKLSALVGVAEEEAIEVMDNRSVNDGLIKYIRDNLKGHYKLGFLSNVGSSWSEDIVGKDTMSLFDEVVLSFQVGAVKPDRAMYDAIVKKLGVGYDECVFIDDQPRYCEGARAVGIKAIEFKDNEQALSELAIILEGGRA